MTQISKQFENILHYNYPFFETTANFSLKLENMSMTLFSRSKTAPRTTSNIRKVISIFLSASIISALFSFPVSAAGSWEDAESSALWNYAFVTLGNFNDDPSSSSGEHAIGPIAVGGNFTVGTYSFADNGTDPGTLGIPQLLVAGNATSTNANTLRGNLVVSTTSTVTGAWSYKTGYSKVVSNPLPVNFTTEAANMKALSAEIATYSAANGINITPTGSGWTTAEFVGTNTTLNVFNLNASGGVNEVKIKCPTGSQIIINVTGASTFALPNVFVWNGTGYVQLSGETQPIDHELLWNFDATTTITSSYVMTRGAILAPYAAVNLTGGNSNGTIICNSYTGSSEIHWSSYTSGFSFLAVPNTVPDAKADTATTAEDTPVTVSVLTNDTDADGDTLTVTGVTVNPLHGTCVVNASGTITYTPTGNYSGTDTFTYGISDGNGGTDTATVTITITAVNDAPDAIADTATTAEDTPVTVIVLANDTDPDGNALTVTGVTTGPSHGTCIVNASGTITYTPTGNYSGTDTFTYAISDGNGGTDTATVTITINAANDVPDAKADTAATAEDTPVKVSVLANDTDADGDTLTVTGVTVDPTNGTCVVNADGTITYTPNANYSGTDTFTYAISDGNGGTDTATVTITVTSAADAPEATHDDETTAEDTPVIVDVLTNDTDADGDTLTVTGVTTGPSNGTCVVNADGTITYTPDANYSGTDTFTYAISDGNGGTDTATVTITINAANDVPDAKADTETTAEDTSVIVDVLTNDTDADGDTLTVTGVTTGPSNGTCVVNADGTITYTPDKDYTGTDTFTYGISDGNGGTDTATVTITVTGVNDAPDAIDDGYTTTEDTSVSLNVLTNDTDVDKDTITVVTNTAPSHGTVTVNADGTGTYTPDKDYSGSDTFTYTIFDGKGGTDTATVTITVTGAADAPEATHDDETTTEEIPVIVDVLTNDTDADGDTLTVTGVTVDPTNGTCVVNADGTITYTPDANYSGTDTFTYAISDGNGGTDTATVTITVTSAADAPEATHDDETTAEDTPVIVDVLTNDTDADGDTLTVTGVTVDPTNGTCVVNADGTITYTPDANYSGTDTFTYGNF